VATGPKVTVMTRIFRLELTVLVVALSLCAGAIAQTEMASVQAPRAEALSRNSQLLGFDLTKTNQHFYLYKNGGAIDLSAKNIEDVGSIAAVRRYLEKQEKAFAAGDIELQKQVYATELPPSLLLIRKLRDEISFSYTSTDEGGALRMFTINNKAREAIHDYLKHEIKANQTDDPLTVQE
jgi:hypothetical protein